MASFTIWSRSISLKIELAALVLVLSLFLQSRHKPLNLKQLDDMEAMTLLANSLVLIAGLGIFVSESDGTPSTSSAVAYVVFAAFVVVCVGILLWILLFVQRYSGDTYVCDDVMSSYLLLRKNRHHHHHHHCHRTSMGITS